MQDQGRLAGTRSATPPHHLQQALSLLPQAQQLRAENYVSARKIKLQTHPNLQETCLARIVATSLAPRLAPLDLHHLVLRQAPTPLPSLLSGTLDQIVIDRSLFLETAHRHLPHQVRTRSKANRSSRDSQDSEHQQNPRAPKLAQQLPVQASLAMLNPPLLQAHHQALQGLVRARERATFSISVISLSPLSLVRIKECSHFQAAAQGTTWEARPQRPPLLRQGIYLASHLSPKRQANQTPIPHQQK